MSAENSTEMNNIYLLCFVNRLLALQQSRAIKFSDDGAGV
jgi:hypothetical protein